MLIEESVKEWFEKFKSGNMVSYQSLRGNQDASDTFFHVCTPWKKCVELEDIERGMLTPEQLTLHICECYVRGYQEFKKEKEFLNKME